jgi:hypothetical protein
MSLKGYFWHVAWLTSIASAAKLPVPCAADETMDLPTLTAAVRSQLSAISSIEVKHHMELISTHSMAPDWSEDCDWAEQGECRLFVVSLFLWRRRA